MSDEANATNDTSAIDDGQGATEEAAVAEAVTAEAEAPAPEQKAETKEETSKEEKSEEKSEKSDVPESYEFKAPDGMELDTELVSEFDPIAKELGLSQEGAQKLVDMYAGKILPRMQAQQAELMAETVAQWADTAKADKEFGGDEFDANMGIAKHALEKFGSEDLVSYLNESGLGNHPEMIRAFYRIGKAISDDSVSVDTNGGGQPRSVEEVFYPSMTKTA